MEVEPSRPSQGSLLLVVQLGEPRVGSVVSLQQLPAVQPLTPSELEVVPWEMLFVATVVPQAPFPLAWMP